MEGYARKRFRDAFLGRGFNSHHLHQSLPISGVFRAATGRGCESRAAPSLPRERPLPPTREPSSRPADRERPESQKSQAPVSGRALAPPSHRKAGGIREKRPLQGTQLLRRPDHGRSRRLGLPPPRSNRRSSARTNRRQEPS